MIVVTQTDKDGERFIEAVVDGLFYSTQTAVLVAQGDGFGIYKTPGDRWFKGVVADSPADSALTVLGYDEARYALEGYQDQDDVTTAICNVFNITAA